jgi:eukaryotic-like serine/threonine-protein kinase
MKFLKDLFKKKPKLVKTDLTKRFDLIGRVGQGSMSKVWRARDSQSGKMVALKVLDKEKTRRLEDRFPGLDKPTEGEVAVQLDHPHIVNTYEHGLSKNKEQFLVMEFVEGVGLSYLVDMQNDQMQEDRLRYIIELGSAIEYFHKANWIHRDICPRNVIVTSDRSIKLIDFGLVVPNTPDFQKPGNRTGTASYMAPELIKRKKTDQRIDMFSYAITCYEMYAKRHPWDAVGMSLEMAIQHINQTPKDIREFVSGIDDQVADTIMKGMALEVRDRCKNMTEMIEQFEDARERLEAGSAE